jgi:deoxyribonuclease-4
MVKLGAHMSIAGGYYKAVDAAAQFGMDVVQLFTKNNNQWNAKEITQAEVQQFSKSLKDSGVSNPLSHASYLINLASPKDDLWAKSIDAMVVEWQRAAQLGLDGVVVHPGAFVDSNAESGLDRIVQGVSQAAQRKIQQGRAPVWAGAWNNSAGCSSEQASRCRWGFA